MSDEWRVKWANTWTYVELNSGNTSMDALNDLLGDLGGLDEVGIKTVWKFVYLFTKH